MAQPKKSNTQIETEENLVLPQFGCKCGLEYSTLSSLSNHIKMTHQNNVDEWKIKRGVPEGRRQRLSSVLKDRIKNYLKSNERIRKDNLSEKISQSQCRGLFMVNVKYIEDLMEKHNLSKQQEIILQKEHIKFQELWNEIDISEICNQTQQYLNSYCFVFFDILPDQTKQEDIEEQKEERIYNKPFEFYKNLLENNKSIENKEMKQKNERNSFSSIESPKNITIKTNNLPNESHDNNSNNNNANNSFTKSYNNIMSNSSSPQNDSFFVNVHPSLNFKDDQYMLNFFKNYLQSEKNENSS